MKLHIIYTLNSSDYQEEKEFETFQDAEVWLEEIGASYWEIGINDEDFKHIVL